MSKKRQKSRAAMTRQEFCKLLESMRFNLVELNLVTKIPYSTLQDYKYGKRGIPGHVARLMRAEEKKATAIRAELFASMEQRIAHEYPQRFMSELEDHDDTETE